jgi:3-methyl-2-oxobutanoate hydroxymethyltransferase
MAAMPAKVTVRTLREMKSRREKITALTAYDAPTARWLDEAGVELILVGDSVANVKLGYADTLPVTLEEMLHHTRAVTRGARRALVAADMPFLTYEYDPRAAVKAVGRFVKEGGAQAVKMEGGEEILPSLRALVRANVPVLGHLGLTPQAVHRLGGWRVQGRDPAAAQRILDDARRLEDAGIFALVLEAVPEPLARRVTESVGVPTLGIGAGRYCDGQILVVDDLLGLTPLPRPKFVRAYAELGAAARRAVARFRADVRGGRFPGPGQTYK